MASSPLEPLEEPPRRRSTLLTGEHAHHCTAAASRGSGDRRVCGPYAMRWGAVRMGSCQPASLPPAAAVCARRPLFPTLLLLLQSAPSSWATSSASASPSTGECHWLLLCRCCRCAAVAGAAAVAPPAARRTANRRLSCFSSPQPVHQHDHLPHKGHGRGQRVRGHPGEAATHVLFS